MITNAQDKIKQDLAKYFAENNITDVKKGIYDLRELLTPTLLQSHQLEDDSPEMFLAWIALQIKEGNTDVIITKNCYYGTVICNKDEYDDVKRTCVLRLDNIDKAWNSILFCKYDDDTKDIAVIKEVNLHTNKEALIAYDSYNVNFIRFIVDSNTVPQASIMGEDPNIKWYMSGNYVDIKSAEDDIVIIAELNTDGVLRCKTFDDGSYSSIENEIFIAGKYSCIPNTCRDQLNYENIEECIINTNRIELNLINIIRDIFELTKQNDDKLVDILRHSYEIVEDEMGSYIFERTYTYSQYGLHKIPIITYYFVAELLAAISRHVEFYKDVQKVFDVYTDNKYSLSQNNENTYKLYWNRPLSTKGAVLVKETLPDPNSKTYANYQYFKCIEYTDVNGNKRIASPYIPGIISVKKGTKVYLQIIAESSVMNETSCSWYVDGKDVDYHEGYACGFLQSGFEPTSDGEVVMQNDTFGWWIDFIAKDNIIIDEDMLYKQQVYVNCRNIQNMNNYKYITTPEDCRDGLRLISDKELEYMVKSVKHIQPSIIL